jgi:hypothetical protein
MHESDMNSQHQRILLILTPATLQDHHTEEQSTLRLSTKQEVNKVNLQTRGQHRLHEYYIPHRNKDPTTQQELLTDVIIPTEIKTIISTKETKPMDTITTSK